jgi:hypothetical protein
MEDEMDIKEYLADAQCWIRVKKSALSSILEDGCIKSQFEVGSIAALNDLEKRAEIEQRHFGYSLDLPVEQRPIYGYLSAQTDGDATHGHLILDQYGEVAIRLKDEVKRRTTFCAGDSLGSQVGIQPAPLLAPEIKAFGSVCDLDVLPPLDALIPYVEAQYHGGVSLAEVAEVVFYEWEDVIASGRRGKWRQRLMDELSEHGIPSRLHIIEE